MAAAVALALGLVPPLLPVQASTMWDGCPDNVIGRAGWTEVASPPFRQGPRVVTSVAADPADPRIVVVSNGWEAWRTTDAGCTWENAIAFQYTTSLTLAGADGKRVRAYWVGAYVGVNNNGLLNVQVLGRNEEGNYWSSLPADMSTTSCSGENRCLLRYAGGKRLDVAYGSTTGAGSSLPAVARSADGGQFWEKRNLPSTGATPLALMDMAVDPLDPDHVLAIADGTVFESTDGANTWATAAVPRSLSPLARVAFADRPVVVDTVDGETYVAVAEPGSLLFRDVGLRVADGPVADIVMAPTESGRAIHVAAGGSVYRHDPAKGLALRVPATGVNALAPTSTGMWARSDKLLFIAADPSAPTAPARRTARAPVRPPVSPADEVRGKAYGGLLVVGDRLVVPPGQSVSTTVLGGLARQPRGIDVFFVMDTTGSMVAKVQPMAVGFSRVVDALNEKGVPARFGLASYGDRSWRYRRLADLGTPPAEVQRRLMELTASGGDEFHYTAFYQLATGHGVDATDGGDVAPGLQASFAPGALHVVVHATDDIDRGDPDGPSREAALDALNHVQARHVGIYPWSLSTVGVPGFEDHVLVNLKEYAAATRTLAPEGGIDCNGDTLSDIDQGEPIACAVPGGLAGDAPIAELLTRVLLAFAGKQPAALYIPPTPLEAQATPLGDYRALDLGQAHDSLEFRVDVTCPADLRGQRVDLPLELHVDGVPVARAVQPVECLAAPRPRRTFAEPTARPIPPRAVGLVPPAAQAPPALAQSVASAEATSSASSSVGAHAAQVGMAAAPDDVVEVVRAEAGGDDELRFVAARRRPAAPVVPAAGLVFAAALVALRLAVRPRAVEQRSRR